MDRPPLDLAELDRRTLNNKVLREDLLRLFREHGPLALSKLMAAANTRDAAAASAAAHRLKGSAATVAATPLSDISRRLEAALRADDWDAVAVELDAAAAELDRCLRQIEHSLTD